MWRKIQDVLGSYLKIILSSSLLFGWIAPCLNIPRWPIVSGVFEFMADYGSVVIKLELCISLWVRSCGLETGRNLSPSRRNKRVFRKTWQFQIFNNMTVFLFRNLWILSHTERTRKLFTSPGEGGGSRGSLGSVEQKYSCCSHKQRETACAGLHCLGCCSVCHGRPDTHTATQLFFIEQGKQNGKFLKHVTTLMVLLIWQPDSPQPANTKKRSVLLTLPPPCHSLTHANKHI